MAYQEILYRVLYRLLCQSLCLGFLSNLLFLNPAFSNFIGKDDREKITIEDKANFLLASRVAMVEFCGFQSTGILTKLKNKSDDYMLISGHHLYNGNGQFRKYDSNKNGKIEKSDKRCNLDKFKAAKIAFNLHYLNTQFHDFSLEIERGLINEKPINHKDARNYWATGEDVLIVKLSRKISEQILPDSNKKRGYLRFLNPGDYKIKHLDGNSKTLAFNVTPSLGIMKSENCEVKAYHNMLDPRVNFKTKCDVTAGSSNSPILTDVKGEAAVWGIVISSPKKAEEDNVSYEKWAGFKKTERLVKEYGLAIANGDKADAVDFKSVKNSTPK